MLSISLALVVALRLIAAEVTDNNVTSNAAQCLDARHHKPEPDTAGELHHLCSAWDAYSCCHRNTTVTSHASINHYGFDIAHCGAISEQCRRHFQLDMCYYECDPYIKPWIVKMGRAIGRERIMSVPLCESQCQRWWDDCKTAYTCVRNWAKHFTWTQIDNTTTTNNNNSNSTRRNVCPDETTCQPFYKIYFDAKDFCETIWDNSWLVVPDDEKCIQFEFQQPNPNKLVAEWYLQTSESTDAWSLLAIFILLVFILAFCFYKFVPMSRF